jgi:cell division protein FtsB
LRRRDLDLRRSWRQNRSRVALVVLACFTVLVLLTAVFGEQGMLRVRHLNQERSDLQERIARLDAETADLRGKVRVMQSDPFPYEKAARERLGYARPGEVVYDFRSDPLGAPR